jgi:hypothetical protein
MPMRFHIRRPNHDSGRRPLSTWDERNPRPQPPLPQRWRVETLQVFRLSIGRSPLRRPLGNDQPPPANRLRARCTLCGLQD